MRIASWNVNSVKARLPRLIAWLEQRQPDVLLLQETKATDETWPAAELTELGYASAHNGGGRWNGVAVLSRVGLADVTRGLTGQPAFDGVVEERAIGATCAGIRLWSLYVPNGRSVGHAHYEYKLEFLRAVRDQVIAERSALGSELPYAVLGDFNVAPRDSDVWDIGAFDGLTHVTPSERAAVADLATVGEGGADLTDLMPRASADETDGRPR